MTPFPAFQSTLQQPVSFEGIGVHSGAPARVVVHPAGADHGLVFRRSDESARDPLVPARWDRVGETRLGTTLVNAGGVSVATVEHLLAALAGLAVDNALIDIDGPEMPILDGSSAPFLAALEAAGTVPQAAPRRYIEVREEVSVLQGDKSASLSPHAGFALDVTIDYPAKVIGRQRAAVDLGAEGFKAALAPARTFGFAHEVEALRAIGLARGGSLDNALVIDGDRLLNDTTLHFPDEFARHKALDAVGDLALAGAPLLARYTAEKGGHALNNALLRALFARPEAFRVVTRAP